MNEVLRYPVAALTARYLRAGVGLVATLGPLLWLQPTLVLLWIFAAGAFLFLLYLWQTVVRHLTRIEIEESGVRARGLLGTALRWEDLRAVHLGYYSTRNDRGGGWMQLEVRGAARLIKVDSTLAGFERLVARVAGEAQARGHALDPTTRENLDRLASPTRRRAG